MAAEPLERRAMERALALAWRGWGRVHPNPMVGAVVLRDDQVVGEGWHGEFGAAHAERSALTAAGEAARGGTLVVTLEPCAHHGKQPPCTDAIVTAGLRRVVFALDDPNPEAAGGTALLEQHGIAVERGLASDEAAAQNAAFLHRFAVPGRPWTALKLATSLDDRIADDSGRSQWISGEDARAWVHWLRAGFDAIAVGAGTVSQDNPALTVRGEVVPRIPPRRVVFDRSLATRPDARVLDPSPAGATIIFTARERAESEAAATLRRAGADVRPMSDLHQAMQVLRSLGVERLLVEGGGRLASALLDADLIDRYYRVASPLWLGSGGRPAFASLRNRALGTADRWRVTERRALGADTLLVVDRG